MTEAGQRKGESDLTRGQHQEDQVEGRVPAVQGNAHDQEHRRDRSHRRQEIVPNEA